MKAPKVLITLVALVGFLEFEQPAMPPYEVLDFFAGVARVSKLSRGLGQSTASFDIGFHQDPNVFDINSPAGMVLSVYAMLNSRFDEALASVGLCCSSYVVTSRGSTHRSFITPMGNEKFLKVRLSNQMTSRTILLLVLFTACGGVWVLEQPGTSIVTRHRRFRWLVRKFNSLGLRVFVQRFFMKYWGHATPKPSVVFGNTSAIRMLFHGKMTKTSLSTSVKTTRRYHSKDGKLRFAGTAQLKGTQVYPWRYAAKLMEIHKAAAMEPGKDCLPPVDSTTELTHLYSAYPWHDLWQDAKIAEAISYVRGSKKLRLPPEWRMVLPQSLPEDSESEEGF